MKVFHVLAYEGYVAKGQPIYSSPSLSELFGSVEHLHIGGYTTQVLGTDPELTIQEQISLDGQTWTLGALLTGSLPIPLDGIPETLFQGADFDPDNYPFAAKAPFARLLITLSASSGSASAAIRVWATGRDSSRRSRALTSAG